MPKLYHRKGSRNWFASIYVWDESASLMVRKRVSTGTDNEDEALGFAEALESTAKAAKAQAGRTISRSHAQALFTSLLSQAGITVDGDKPLPLLRDFLDHYMAARAKRVSAGSMKTYQSSARKFGDWLDPQKVIDPRLDWLTTERAESYYSHLRERLAVKTAREHFKWLARAMKRAVEITDLAKNPCEGIELDSKGTTLDRLPFSLPEANQIIAWLLSQGDREREWARATMLALMAGCRVEDALTMTQDAISEEVLRYRQKKTGKVITCPLINAEWLAVIVETGSGYVSPTLAKEFTEWGNARLSSQFTSYVSAAKVEQRFQTFKSGRKIARKTFHSLRHTLRTAIVSSGGSDAQADVILGHSEGEGKRYTHSEVDAMRGTLEKALKPSGL